MTEPVFFIKQRPDGKFIFESGLATYGPFDSKPAAEEGLKRFISPPSYPYDKNGDPIR